VLELELEEWLKSNRPGAEREGRVRVRSGNTPDRLSGATTFHLKDATLRVSDESFFQVNTALIETLVDQVVTQLEPQPHETILDAYCGVGLFSRFLAPQAARVIGIESSASAVDDFRVNLAGFDRVEVQRGRVEEVLPQLDRRITAAVFDPPRAGCGPRVIEATVAQRIDRVVVVSCDPATLARDVRKLIDNDYHLIDVQPIDLFPHTYHIETSALLHRTNGAIL
jgi:23S rRNA (uracil1939-C5)-methyltransferase